MGPLINASVDCMQWRNNKKGQTKHIKKKIKLNKTYYFTDILESVQGIMTMIIIEKS
jgi:hypothetical protein